MDNSPAVDCDEVKEAGLTCPVKACKKYFKKGKTSNLLKHYKRCHPNKYFLKCPHCPRTTEKLNFMRRHIMQSECLDAEPEDFSCDLYSSRRLKSAKFESLSFSIEFHCLFCKYECDDVGDFNSHFANHPEPEAVNGQPGEDMTFDDIDNEDNAAGSHSRKHSVVKMEAMTSPGSGRERSHSMTHINGSSYDDLESPISAKPEAGLEERDDGTAREVATKEIHGTTRRKREVGEDIDEADVEECDDVNGSRYANRVTEAIFPCLECGKLFTRQRGVEEHMVVHSGERNFACPSCPYRARRQKDLTIHNHTVHQRQRDFTCNVCSMQFMCNTTLKRHARVHDGLKPFRCGTCNKRFTQKGSRSKHYKKYKHGSLGDIEK